MRAASTLAPPGPSRVRLAGPTRRRRRWRKARRGVVALVVLVAVLGGVATLSYEGQILHASRRPVPPAAAARQAVEAFLHRYVAGSGRVVRSDQGGDTVSEGQAYGLLLALSVGDRRELARIWQWERSHLQEADGLFAWHWAKGRVVGRSPASDADLLTAWALVAAGHRFGDPAYLADGRRVARAILAHETVRDGPLLVLAAGPWAKGPPTVVNPSYLTPEAFVALAKATGDAAFRQLEASSRRLLVELERASPAGLPPDWAVVEPSGTVRASGPPSTHQVPVYGLDAQRVAVWYAASCSPATRAVAAEEWAGLRAAPSRGAAIAYDLAGRPLGSLVAPLGWVSAAAAARAAGSTGPASRLLAAASRQQRLVPTYFGGAWVALGRVLLQTDWLHRCTARVAAPTSPSP